METEKKVGKRKHQMPFRSPFQSKQLSKRDLQNNSSITIAELNQKLDSVKEELQQLRAQGLKEEELKTHIDKMHEYNEIKDVGQIILGRLANLEGVCTRDLYKRYGLNLED